MCGRKVEASNGTTVGGLEAGDEGILAVGAAGPSCRRATVLRLLEEVVRVPETDAAVVESGCDGSERGAAVVGVGAPGEAVEAGIQADARERGARSVALALYVVGKGRPEL